MELILKKCIQGPYRMDSCGCCDILPRLSFKSGELIPPVAGSEQFPIVSPLEEVTHLKRVSPAAYYLSRETCMLLLVTASL